MINVGSKKGEIQYAHNRAWIENVKQKEKKGKVSLGKEVFLA